MANTIAEAQGIDKGRIKETHRLGSEASRVVAATWNTEAVAYVARDGSGYVEVRNKRSGAVYHRWDFGPESER